MHPHNISVINEILHLTSLVRDFTVAIEVLQGAFDYYQRIWPNGPPEPPTPQEEGEEPEPTFQDFHIIALADSLIATTRYEQAIKVIRGGARWLQGRRSEAQLDSAPDDREFDADGIVRVDEDRILSGEAAKSKTHHLDVNLRHRLARARIKNGDIKEGRVSVLLSR
jgi:general transcription factor 3C polypeptide 3 (transcription factor C subunit 4)